MINAKKLLKQSILYKSTEVEYTLNGDVASCRKSNIQHMNHDVFISKAMKSIVTEM